MPDESKPTAMARICHNGYHRPNPVADHYIFAHQHACEEQI
jgi:hypothetical protein